MDSIVRVTSKGQVTIPQKVREALGIKEGDALLFRTSEGSVTVTRVPALGELAGLVTTPRETRDLPWPDVRSRAWEEATADKA